jgi:spore germination protein GerM
MLAVALGLAGFAVVRLGRNGEPPRPAAPVVDTAPPTTTDVEPPTESPSLRTVQITVYYPAVDGEGLLGEPREIFDTATPGDRAKQILADLISGPSSENALRAVPQGTLLRQVFVIDGGVAYVDFSAALRDGLGGGSLRELLAVYAIVDSVALNVPEIRRVGILIDGNPIESLTGHVDLRRPIAPDRSWILDGKT